MAHSSRRAALRTTLVVAALLVPVGWVAAPLVETGLLTASYQWGEPSRHASELVPAGFGDVTVVVSDQPGFPLRHPAAATAVAHSPDPSAIRTVVASDLLNEAGWTVTAVQSPGPGGSSASGRHGDLLAHVALSPSDDSEGVTATIQVGWIAGGGPFAIVARALATGLGLIIAGLVGFVVARSGRTPTPRR